VDEIDLMTPVRRSVVAETDDMVRGVRGWVYGWTGGGWMEVGLLVGHGRGAKRLDMLWRRGCAGVGR
jgi:hypothetical protein